MLTLFTLPKPFKGHNGVIQRNAVESWTRLQPACEVLLLGDEPGTAEVAAQCGARHIPDVRVNEFGTPLLDSAFDAARRSATGDILCYVNSDIMFLDDFPEAVSRLDFRKTLMVGERRNIDITAPWDFDRSDWQAQLDRHVREHGVLQGKHGIDYFVFHRDGALGHLPPFAVGRPKWDNWFLYDTREKGCRLVDASAVVNAIHQNHDYNHVPQRKGKQWFGPEADQNRELMGDPRRYFTILHATHVLKPTGLYPALGYRRIRARWRGRGVLTPWLGPVVRTFDKVVDGMLVESLRPLVRALRGRTGSPRRPSHTECESPA